ncbi:cytidylate kinase [Buchnera aphidicola str. Bp (Baizongia pistaciae)]|uniref:Cytidylate kinase n=1 Tax=Buchnera aphidicola subsp. Baizongia pistaciae (strain Bp) TaxID=224915 RepID=KCY_BUCBP|nr:(d)CMP kinase [Buchnera aphidicola]P59580.1 RecName: Full=Cytidylate kinase; Short=CK; AltName: Full=Cytidine monophosphate kinase; Short=CMP kinase [Buchnera aphidicola str. Bp (Baizongia pistaciae)]AAO27012.1 cytidylate kinase [Buchnera aphidicola str. Bp (Baizongia pistaciae)]
MSFKNLVPVITIDGPSGVGKSSVCKVISKKLQWNVLESGWIYRVLAFIIFKNNVCFSSRNLNILFKNINLHDFIQRINFKNYVISQSLFTNISQEYIGNLASRLACIPYIRHFLLFQQRSFRKFPGLIANGRDMGTVVFPDAIIKFFLISDFKTRVARRCLEYEKKGINSCNYKKIFYDMKTRDQRDHNRKISPLIPAKNAILIDSTYMSLKQVSNVLLSYILKMQKFKL